MWRYDDGEVYANMVFSGPGIATGASTVYHGTDATAALGVLVAALLQYDSL